MKNLIRILLLPVVFLIAIYYVCYEVFWWTMIEEDSAFTRSFNLGAGRGNPIQDAMEFARDLVT